MIQKTLMTQTIQKIPVVLQKKTALTHQRVMIQILQMGIPQRQLIQIHQTQTAQMTLKMRKQWWTNSW